MSKTIKFSELDVNVLIGHDGKIISYQEAANLILQQNNGAMVLVPELFFYDMLDVHPMPYKFELPADCKKIIVDLIPRQVQFIAPDDKMDYYEHSFSPKRLYFTVWGSGSLNYYKETKNIMVVDDDNDLNEIDFGDYRVLTLLNEQEVI